MSPGLDRISRPDRLAHLVLRSPCDEEAIHWWTTVLGAHVVHRSNHLALLTYDDEHHQIAILRQDLLGNDGRDHAGLERGPHPAGRRRPLGVCEPLQRLAGHGDR